MVGASKGMLFVKKNFPPKIIFYDIIFLQLIVLPRIGGESGQVRLLWVLPDVARWSLSRACLCVLLNKSRTNDID